MFPQPRFSSLVPTPVEEYDASACYLHYDLEDSDCSPPDEDLLGKRTNSLPPDGSIDYDFPEQARASDAPAVSEQSAFHVGYLQTAAVIGHQDIMQGTANCYGMSHLIPFYFPSVDSVAFDSSVGSVQATEVNVPAEHPALPQVYLGPFSNDASAVVTSATSVGSLATADTPAFPSEISQVHPIPIHFTNATALGAPQVTSQPYRRPCEWKNNGRRICGELVGWHCQDHLAVVHSIVNISGSTRVTCGVCGEKKKRKFILRHFREKHIGFRRTKRNAA